ncbi:flagellar assembly peptidoglycan hydrolase FlgJ [Photobacterium sp. TY1-4]|uniref:flagellar assembly peptidoglycan hydrolase FlgJ n=1 Tax=Photobacterium sp. TY1-4 TaxID=2899122 RepID=UPI0021BE36CB|nr:flagellar assembly peptidoglycan hydrolase FlgJ [Photobacterium sp. TY1-4]UXI00596.1 flagellar assembly peptidoglycan hydrolase FlgJ [Photobacterium sp. TY1-4]
MKTTEPGFIHDISNLERLRAGINNDESASLRGAAQQFEALFTQMLFKSMRQANEAFESDLMSSNNTKFFEQMRDEQMASELSTTGSLGLADLIVSQLGGVEDQAVSADEPAFREAAKEVPLNWPPEPKPLADRQSDKAMPVDKAILTDKALIEKAADDALSLMQKTQPATFTAPLPPRKVAAPEPEFRSPEDFVSRMRPYAEKAAHALGTDPSVLIAQAALETGWGKKVIRNAAGNSNNLFNIKADPRWSGNKVATSTLEFHNGIPVQETAAFRSYDNYQQSFNDYVRFLNENPRYSQALEQPADPVRFIRNLHQAGYATDPKYSDKVISVMDTVKRLMQ